MIYILIAIAAACLFAILINYLKAIEKKKEKQRKKQEKKDREKKFAKILDLMAKDFSKNPYSEKMSMLGSHDFYFNFAYRFENGYDFEFAGDRIRLRDRNGSVISEFEIGYEQKTDLLYLIRNMCESARSRRSSYGHSEREKKEERKDEYAGCDPKKADRLKKLDEKIRLREEQLSKMHKGHPDRQALLNELAAYRGVANRIKAGA